MSSERTEYTDELPRRRWWSDRVGVFQSRRRTKELLLCFVDIWNVRMTCGKCSVLFSKMVSVDEKGSKTSQDIRFQLSKAKCNRYVLNNGWIPMKCIDRWFFSRWIFSVDIFSFSNISFWTTISRQHRRVNNRNDRVRRVTSTGRSTNEMKSFISSQRSFNWIFDSSGTKPNVSKINRLEGKSRFALFRQWTGLFSTIVDVSLTIIRNNQYSSRTRTVKDYLSFILAVTIGLFRLEEGRRSSDGFIEENPTCALRRNQYENDSNASDPRTHGDGVFRGDCLSCETFPNGYTLRTDHQVRCLSWKIVVVI